MLRRCVERREFVAAERDEHAARTFAELRHGFAHVGRVDPPVAGDGAPRRPAQPQQWQARLARRFDGIAGHDARVWMRGVDQRIHAFVHQIVREARGTAKAAAPDRHRLWQRRSGAAGERQRDSEAGTIRQPPGQQSRFGGAAKNEDALHAAP